MPTVGSHHLPYPTDRTQAVVPLQVWLKVAWSGFKKKPDFTVHNGMKKSDMVPAEQ